MKTNPHRCRDRIPLCEGPRRWRSKEKVVAPALLGIPLGRQTDSDRHLWVPCFSGRADAGYLDPSRENVRRPGPFLLSTIWLIAFEVARST